MATREGPGVSLVLKIIVEDCVHKLEITISLKNVYEQHRTVKRVIEALRKQYLLKCLGNAQNC